MGSEMCIRDRIGITCRQPFLGAEEWIEEEIKKNDGESTDDTSVTEKTAKEIKVKK